MNHGAMGPSGPKPVRGRAMAMREILFQVLFERFVYTQQNLDHYYIIVALVSMMILLRSIFRQSS
jgi:hypothetical protein